MKTKQVVVETYSAKWVSDFEKIKRELDTLLNGSIEAIYHIGSTSVIGMSAKPIIDIDIVIESNSYFSEVKKKLEAIGYIHEGNLGIAEREAFTYKDKNHLRIHHLYVCPAKSKELKRHLSFKNFLLKHPAMAKEYSELKLCGARKYLADVDRYIKFKSGMIEKIYRMIDDEK